MEPRRRIIAYAIKYNGDFDKIITACRKGEEIEDDYFIKVDQMKCQTVTLIDKEYPPYLKNVYKPPIVLFYYGDLSLIFDYKTCVSIVGSRENSEYGERITKEIVSGLATRGYSIVSGLAKGIDAIAHQAAIDSGGRTVAVLGCGIDYCYPIENLHLYKEIKKNHLLISEYPGDIPPQMYYFPIRNRIIAGLSKTLVVTEAGENSGSLITATLALRGNTDVMCVPHEAGKKSGCNSLIRCGAYLVESADDVVEQMSLY